MKRIQFTKQFTNLQVLSTESTRKDTCEEKQKEESEQAGWGSDTIENGKRDVTEKEQSDVTEEVKGEEEINEDAEEMDKVTASSQP